jgi:hypothetical protein
MGMSFLRRSRRVIKGKPIRRPPAKLDRPRIDS